MGLRSRRSHNRILVLELGPGPHEGQDGCWMHTEQPGCISRGLFALGEHFDNFCLLLGFELRRRPPIRPSFRAASRPVLVGSFSIARSNSAKAPTICIIMRPAGVVVSIASVKLRKPALTSPPAP